MFPYFFPQTQLGKSVTEVQLMIKDRMRKVEEIRQSVQLSKVRTGLKVLKYNGLALVRL